MRPLEIGLVLPLMPLGGSREASRWTTIRDLAIRAEEVGFDSVWVPDELVWQTKEPPNRGAWDGISMLGAVAAMTTRVKIGSWVLSALHRNPGIIAKTVETLDEVSGGRFVFGLGAGHAWPGQARMFGLPEDHIFDRFGEALEIIVPLLRAGRAEFEGSWHTARGLDQIPVGPRPGKIPLLIGGNGPKGQRHAVRHADIWSAYVEERAHADEVGPRIATLEAICAEEGRDPASIGRSIGLIVAPFDSAGTHESRVSGTTAEIAAAIRSFRETGYTQVELMIEPSTLDALEAVTPVLELRGG